MTFTRLISFGLIEFDLYLKYSGSEVCTLRNLSGMDDDLGCLHEKSGSNGNSVQGSKYFIVENINPVFQFETRCLKSVQRLSNFGTRTVDHIGFHS
jgi:hypothetical protein